MQNDGTVVEQICQWGFSLPNREQRKESEAKVSSKQGKCKTMIKRAFVVTATQND